MSAPQWADKAHYAALDPRAARTHLHGGGGPPRGRPPACRGGGAPPRGGGRSWQRQEGERIGGKPPWESPLSAGNNEREGGEGGSAAATRLPSNPNPISTGGRGKLDGRPGGQQFPLPLFLSPPSQTDRGDDEARALPHQRPLRKVQWGFIVGWPAAAAGVTTRRGAGGPTQGSCAVGASHLLRCPPISAPLRPPVVPRAVVASEPRLLFPSVPYPHLCLATPRFSAPLCNVGPRGGHILFRALQPPLQLPIPPPAPHLCPWRSSQGALPTLGIPTQSDCRSKSDSSGPLSDWPTKMQGQTRISSLRARQGWADPLAPPQRRGASRGPAALCSSTAAGAGIVFEEAPRASHARPGRWIGQSRLPGGPRECQGEERAYRIGYRGWGQLACRCGGASGGVPPCGPPTPLPRAGPSAEGRPRGGG